MGRRVPVQKARSEELSVGDTIEYGLTEELSLDHGRKAWVRFATVSAVREGETTQEAVDRVAGFVESGHDERKNQ